MRITPALRTTALRTTAPRTPALRTLTVALLSGGTFAVAALGTTAAAAPSASTDVPATRHSGSGAVRGTVTSRTDLTLRQAPTTHAPSAGTLAPGSRDLVECRVLGQSVNGDAHWYWLAGARAWASAAFVSTGGERVPDCADPCPRWKDDDWANWNDAWDDEPWSVTGSGSVGFSFSFSGSWSFSATGSVEGSATGSDGGSAAGGTTGASPEEWVWVPLVR
ncbi:SH3 domain-containing protein [Streptomyces sp. NPDC017202]|uniref:SH3 domain-containing protein n=1 Tax=Streptomyces sp. NPDC017202 TaxID=3364981 RepID=UPI0037BD8F2C